MVLSWAIIFSASFMFLEVARVSRVISRFLAITPLFFLFVMLAFNRMNNDYLAYQEMFISDQYNSQIEFGYTYLINFLKYFGKSHEAVVLLAGSLLVFTLIKMMKNSRHVNLVIFLYCCFPLVYDINQTRNLLMYLIVILSLGFVEKKKPVKYYLGIFLAFSIHKLALVYLPFYYLCQKNRKQFISLIWKLFILFSIASPLIVNLFSWLFPYKMGAYLSHDQGFGLIIMIAYTILDVFTVWWVDKKISSKLSEEENKKMEVLYRFVWFSILILPFTAYIFELKRLQRNALLVKYIYCAFAMNHLSVKDKLITLFLLLVSVVLPILVMVYNGEILLFKDLDENSIKYYVDRYLF